MSSEEKEPETLGQLKTLVLHKVENLLFQVSALLYVNQEWEALDLLWQTFALIPPDISYELEREEQKLQSIRYGEINNIATARFIGPRPLDAFDKTKAIVKLANSYSQWMRMVVRKIQKLLYERYLVEGYIPKPRAKSRERSMGVPDYGS